MELTGTNSPDTLNYATLSFRPLKVLLVQLSDGIARAPARGRDRDQVSGADSGGVPPVPIPNTAVKTASADGSRTAGSLESRTAPDFKHQSPPAAMSAGCAQSPRPNRTGGRVGTQDDSSAN
jgi:hypothetical protein